MFSRPGGAFDFEIVAVELIEIQKTSNQENVYWHPNWPPPIGIPAEHSGIRLRRQILNFKFLPPEIEYKGMLQVEAGQRANAIGPQELVFVEHVSQNPLNLLLVADRQESAVSRIR